MVWNDHPLELDVPQGSVLEPVLFALYITTIENTITRHSLNAVIYADDTQVCIAFDSRTDSRSEGRSEVCIDEIAVYEGKTEIIRFASRTKNASVGFVTGDVRVGEVYISPSAAVRDVGMMDLAGLIDDQIESVCNKASKSLWRIGEIRHLLHRASTEKLVHCSVTSKLGYCNSISHGHPAYKIETLQHIQNAAARRCVQRNSEQQKNIAGCILWS